MSPQEVVLFPIAGALFKDFDVKEVVGLLCTFLRLCGCVYLRRDPKGSLRFTKVKDAVPAGHPFCCIKKT